MTNPAFEPEPERWARQTFLSAELGDARRSRRLVDIAARQAANPCGTVYANTGTDPAAREGAYRFLNSDEVMPQAIAAAGHRATAQACAGRVVISAEDTTTLSFRHRVREDLGPVGGPKGTKSRGWLVHSSLAIDADSGEVLGPLGQRWWVRNEGKTGTKKVLESEKWRELGDEVLARARQAGVAKLISVCDREADIFGLLMHKVAGCEHFVIRAMHDRALGIPDARRLREHIERQPVMGERLVQIGQRGSADSRSGKRPGRKARSTTLEVRATTVELQPPATVPAEERAPIEVAVVHVREKRAPKDGKPIEWLLLTSEPVGTLEQACRVVDYYEKRWLIEEYHRAWKSGCGAEEALQQTPESLQRWLTILSFVGARILQVRTLATAHPSAPCTRVLPTAYWRCLYAMVNPGKRIPRKIPTALWALESIGKLGGWTPSKNAPHPGYVTLSRGWQKLQMFTAGWEAAKHG